MAIDFIDFFLCLVYFSEDLFKISLLLDKRIRIVNYITTFSHIQCFFLNDFHVCPTILILFKVYSNFIMQIYEAMLLISISDKKFPINSCLRLLLLCLFLSNLIHTFLFLLFIFIPV